MLRPAQVQSRQDPNIQKGNWIQGSTWTTMFVRESQLSSVVQHWVHMPHPSAGCMHTKYSTIGFTFLFCAFLALFWFGCFDKREREYEVGH